VDVAAAVENGGAGRRAQLVFRHAGLGARDHRLHGALAQQTGPAHAAQLLLAVHHNQLMQKAPGENELRVGQRLAQHVVLVDGEIIAVARVDLNEPMRPRSSLSSLSRSTMTSAYLPLRLWRTSDKALAHSRRQASAWVPPMEKTSVGSPSSGTTT